MLSGPIKIRIYSIQGDTVVELSKFLLHFLETRLENSFIVTILIRRCGYDKDYIYHE